MGLWGSLFGNQLVGLDIGISSIKAVELTADKSPRLAAYNRVDLPFGVLTPEGELKDREQLIESIQTLFSKRRFSTKKVAVGAFGNSIITKKISVQQMTKEELDEQMYWEAEQYIPFNINDVNIDFAILGSSNQTTSSGAPMMDVLLVAAKKDYIQELIAIVEEAGLTAEIIDSQPFALGNVYEFNYHLSYVPEPEAAVAIIDVGAGSTKVSVASDRKTIFTRELRSAGMLCTQMLSERLQMPMEEAEDAKIDKPETPSIAPILKDFSQVFSEEVSRTLDFCMSQSQGKTLQTVYVCGGGSNTYGLLDVLESKLSVPVEILNPIQGIIGSGKKMSRQVVEDLANLGSVALGLALRKVANQ